MAGTTTTDPEQKAPRLVLWAFVCFLIAAFRTDWPSYVCLGCGLSLLIASCRSRRDGFLFLGPFVRLELVRSARRLKLPWLRAAYAGGLLLLLTLIYAELFDDAWDNIFSLDAWSMTPRQLAKFGPYFAVWFFGLQFLTLCFLTPAVMASVVTEEKEKQTLDFLLVTDLRNREILFGKLTARVLLTGSFLLVAVPILALLPLMGGIDPQLILTIVVATIVTVLSQTAVAAMCSVSAKKTKTAVGLTIQICLWYSVLAGALFLTELRPRLANFPQSFGISSPIIVRDLVEGANVGNPPAVFGLIVRDVNLSNRSLDEILPGYLRNYVAFHLLVTLLSFGIAIMTLRPVPREERRSGPEERPQPSADVAGRADDASKPEPTPGRGWPKPPVFTDRPILWREMYCEAFYPRTGKQLLLFAVGLLAGVIPLLLVVYFALVGGYEQDLAVGVNTFLRGLGSIVLMVAIAAASGHALQTLPKEREKKTFDELRLTDLSSQEILRDKWWGAILSVRWLWLWFLIAWTLAVWVGGLHPLGILGLILAVIGSGTFTVSLSQYCSVNAPTIKRANTSFARAISLILLLLIGSAMLGQRMFIFPYAHFGPNPLSAYLHAFWFGLVPPIAFGMLSFRGEDLTGSHALPEMQIAGAAGFLTAFVVLLLAGWRLRVLAVRRFDRGPSAEKPV